MAAADDLPRDLVFVDLETTGTNAAYDRITEVGLVRVTDGGLVEEWSSLVHPECSIPAHIESFNGISNEMLADAPRFADIAPAVRRKLEGAVFVAHNARFDYSFLRSEFLKLDMRFSAPVLCTVKLSRRLFPQFARHNLDAVMERNGLTCSARHRALGDAKVLHEFWCKLRRDLAHLELADAVRTLLTAHRLPAHLPPDLADDLPEGPGVYRFFDADSAVLYVGKSRSLRSTVCGHFAAGTGSASNIRLAARVRRVDWLETHGELGALLKEAEWQRTLKPVFNRRSHGGDQSYTLRVRAAASAGQARRVEAAAMDGLEAAELAQSFGVFHSEKDARKALGDIARAHRLCLKVLGLEDAVGSCFAYQVGKCKGVCVGREPPVLHDTRVMLALSSLKLKAWPFPGRVALREQDFRGTALHVVDHWTYLGTARTDEELAALGDRSDAVFDAHVYRILVRHLARHPKLEWIDLQRRSAGSNGLVAAYNDTVVRRQFKSKQ
jgi:DNA polymerase III subunit epsilon